MLSAASYSSPGTWTKTLPLRGGQGDFRKSKRIAAMLKTISWLPSAAGGDWSLGMDHRPRLAGCFLLSTDRTFRCPGSRHCPARQPSFCLPALSLTHALPGTFFSLTHKCMRTYTRTHTPLLLISPTHPAGYQFKPHLSRPCRKPLFLLLPWALSIFGAG